MTPQTEAAVVRPVLIAVSTRRRTATASGGGKRDPSDRSGAEADGGHWDNRLVHDPRAPQSTAASSAQAAQDRASSGDVELELFKLAVEMADRISARRALANTFFLTVNTGLAALLGGNNLRWYVAAAGILFALAWWALLRSYRKLNWAKFEVINAIEPRLPLQPFSDEWRLLESTKAPRRLWPLRELWAWLRGYHELGALERIVPLAFVAIYIAELIRQAIS